MPGMSPRMKAKKGRLGVSGLDPVVRIVSINDGDEFTRTGSPLEVSVTLVGTGTDDLQGDVSASLVWTSDLDGSLGSGASVAATLTTAGTHVITAQATGGSPATTGEETVTITVV